MTRLPSSAFWIGCLCFFLGIALQVQTTLFYHFETYKGLRLCLADLALPVAGLAIAWTLFKKKSLWPAWRINNAYLWLAGLFFILVAALFQTHALFGQWSFWGITNKLPGMIVVIAYFCLGGWLGTNAGQEKLILFFRCLFLFFIGLMLCETIGLLWQDFYHFADYYKLWPDYPLKGFIDNRNAYGLFALVAFSFLVSFMVSDTKILPRFVTCAVAGLMPYFLIQIGSRASFIAAFAMMGLFIFLYRRKIVPVILAAMIGAIMIVGIYFKVPERLLLITYTQFDVVKHVGELGNDKSFKDIAPEIAYMGDNFRLQVLEISKDMILERPLSGSGLGSSFIVQQQERGSRYDIIESTPIWLWVETGLFGLLAFASFYVICLRALIAGSKGDDFYAALNKGMIVAVAIFTIMTCLHELMYTRQIWFLLGLALAAPAGAFRKRQDESTPSPAADQSSADGQTATPDR